MALSRNPESQPAIHPTAIIDPTARLAENVTVGAYAMIHAHAIVQEGNRIEAHAIIGPNTRIGKHNHIHPYAIIGTDSQDAKFQGEETGLIVGDHNIFREFVTINRATGQGSATRVGSHCRFLAYTHIAHNCVVEDGVIMANCAELAGEVHIEKNAILGGLVGVHQFCRIGRHSIVGACSKVTQDIPPFITADGHPARPRGINSIGLRRHQFSAEDIKKIKQAYKMIFRSGMRLEEALDVLEKQQGEMGAIQELVNFIRSSKRSIPRPRISNEEPEDFI
ncbi:MAG: acyl-ACP--UDP-N-acetylglucosamine O-acyltransferase [Candidatus Sumerlaeia bacterium]